MSRILPFLYLGGRFVGDLETIVSKPARVLTALLRLLHNLPYRSDISSNLPKLRELRITHIINCSETLPNHYPDEITYLRIPMPDDPSSRLEGFFSAAAHFIEDIRVSQPVSMLACVRAQLAENISILACFSFCCS